MTELEKRIQDALIVSDVLPVDAAQAIKGDQIWTVLAPVFGAEKMNSVKSTFSKMLKNPLSVVSKVNGQNLYFRRLDVLNNEYLSENVPEAGPDVGTDNVSVEGIQPSNLILGTNVSTKDEQRRINNLREEKFRQLLYHYFLKEEKNIRPIIIEHPLCGLG